jgi:ubiquinone/menaquinone biosynthesis C-methylase UbiE
MSELPESIRASVAGNVEYWAKVNTEYGDADAARTWAHDDITWGQFGVSDAAVGSPLGDVAGKDILEAGCGVAYFSAWLAKRGARPVGLDPTPEQLATARRLQAETGIEFPLVEGVGEALPFPDDSFDMVLSEYGASLWAEPYAWIPECARVLRPGGRLVFLTSSILVQLCFPDVGPATEVLQRPMFGVHAMRWPDDPGTEYHLPHGERIRLLRANGFEILDLIEVQVPEGAQTHEYYSDITAEWGRQWPAEEIWVARLRD